MDGMEGLMALSPQPPGKLVGVRLHPALVGDLDAIANRYGYTRSYLLRLGATMVRDAYEHHMEEDS